MSRVLALLGAVLLIAAAVVVRTVLDDDDGGGGDDGGRELVVACIPELRDACEAIAGPVQLQVEGPDATIARLAAGEDLDAWVTFDPWPAMAEILEDRVAAQQVEVVADTALSALVRIDTPPASCGPAGWECLVESGGRVTLPAASSALGALVLGWAASDWNASARGGEQFARAELDLPEFRSWLDAIEFVDDPIAEAFAFGPAGPQAIGTSLADVARIDGTREVGRLLPTPVPTVARIAVVLAGPEADRVAGDPAFTAALDEVGYDTDGTQRSTGLPNPGLLIALRDVL